MKTTKIHIHGAPTASSSRKKRNTFIAFALACLFCGALYTIFDALVATSSNKEVNHISAQELRRLVTENRNKAARGQL